MFFTAGHKIVVVAEDDYLAYLAADVHRFSRMGPLADQVAEAEDTLDTAFFNIFKDGLQRGHIAVDIGNDGDFFHDDFILQDKAVKGKAAEYYPLLYGSINNCINPN